MPRVMMICPKRSHPIFTGLELPAGSALTGLAKTRVPCPACGGEHSIRRPYFEGHGPDSLHLYWVALEQEPVFSAEVGVLISCFAIIENFIPAMLARLTKMNHNDAFTILSSFETFSQRVELLKALVKTHEGDEIETQALGRILPRLTNAATIRNKYAHGRYSITFDDDFVVESFITSRKPKTVRKSLDAIVADVNVLKGLIVDLQSYLGAGTMPPPWP